MPFVDWGYQFDGRFASPDQVPARAGVYTVWCWVNNGWAMLDVGQAEDMRERLKNHERTDCWNRHCPGAFYFYVVAISDEAERRALERTIRQDKKPPCGEV